MITIQIYDNSDLIKEIDFQDSLKAREFIQKLKGITFDCSYQNTSQKLGDWIKQCMDLTYDNGFGKVKTEESKNYLLKVACAENEPSVIAAAVNSLGEIGINNGDEVVDAISFANRRNEILNPTSSLAFEVIDAYEKLADVTENKKIIIDSLARIAADYHYVTPVRNKALNLLKKMKDTGSQNKSASEAK